MKYTNRYVYISAETQNIDTHARYHKNSIDDKKKGQVSLLGSLDGDREEEPVAAQRCVRQGTRSSGAIHYLGTQTPRTRNVNHKVQ